MTDKTFVQFTIIGGGIIGLSIAKILSQKYPHSEIALFEKSPFLGDETSGRNSGVLHSGIYYPHNSLKHILTIEGHHLWKNSNAKIKKIGKFIFAQSKDEIEAIDKLYENGIKNCVPKIKWANDQELKALNSDVRALKAISSPWTSIIDVPDVIKTLSYECEKSGVMIQKGQEIINLSKSASGHYEYMVGKDVFKTEVLFNCAGLGGVNLRKMLGLIDVENFFVKGHYFTSPQKINSESLLYPIPEKNLHGLGVHSTYDFDGKLKFGPDSMTTLKLDYSFNSDRLEIMKGAVKKIFPNIDISLLKPDYCGIRPKIKVNDSLYTDFWIKKPLPDYIEFLGIESPGLTAAPAIANMALSLL
jgi:L-2-hydroxyglutarate oxidase LhgO